MNLQKEIAMQEKRKFEEMKNNIPSKIKSLEKKLMKLKQLKQRQRELDR